MPEIRHLRFAPITEAIIDIRVKASSGFNIEKFNAVIPALEVNFPIIEKMRGSQVNFQVRPNEAKVPEIKDLGIQGYFFKTPDQTTIAQFRIDGFTLNKLKPYTSWDELQPLAIDLWSKYLSVAQPDAVIRIALRYINHISINATMVDFDEYFRAAPQIPPELPQSITSFLHRTTIFEPEDENFVQVTQVFQQQPTSSGIMVILDIDTYKDIATQPNDANLFNYFSKLRELKNKVFFNYLAEKTIGFFE
jgi:uncharacterized protein (TIGR04255 family)